MKFPSLPAAAALTGAEITPLTQGGVDKRSTVQATRNFPESKAANMASAATLNLAAATGPYVSVTGTTAITALGTVQAGAMFTLHFQGALTLTHNATSLILPGGANIATAAGDVAVLRSEGAGNWRYVGGTRANGLPLAVALDTDGTLAANSDSKIATQKAVKTYVDGIIAVQDAMVYKGVIDCSANPNYPAANTGWTYRISVAGKIGGAAGVNVQVGDIVICLVDGSAAGNQATVGANWNVIQANLDGALTTADIDVDGTLAANSDAKIPSQKAVKTYVDAHSGGGGTVDNASVNAAIATDPAATRGSLGLGTAATTPATDYATAAQGATADSAVQPGDLGTAASADATDFATAAQGATADSALQPSDIGTTVASLVGGTVPSAQIPAIAISEFLGNAADETAMLALTGEKGDWTIRDDTGATWVITGNDPTLLTDWTALSYPGAPVASVNGQVGTVVLGAPDVGAEPTQTAVSQAEAEAGTSTSTRSWTPLRVFQAVAAKLALGTWISGATGKSTPVDADTFALSDSAAGDVLKKVPWSDLKATLKTYFDTLYAAITVTQGKHAVPVMAGAIAPSSAGGCAPLATVASGANLPDIVTVNFDASTQEYAQFAIPTPKSWNGGTITAQFRWSHGATTTNFGVVWGLQAVAVSDDDTIAAAYGTAQEVTDTGGTTDDLYISPETPPITIAGTPVAGDTVYFRAYRKAADGADTLAVDARLHSIVVFLNTNAATDA